jgi:hypothetical protein
MLGQMSLIPPDVTLPLRQRVTVEIITLHQAREALEQFHYLHRVRTGRQINYAVLIDGVVDGVVTYAYPMMSAPLDGVPADELLEFARLFLQSNIPHTATCAIGKTIKRVAADWARLYPDAKPLRLVVSWSDTEYHKGTIYKAANFRWLRKSPGGTAGGMTPGNHNRIRTKHTDYGHMKDCWIYRLDA